MRRKQQQQLEQTEKKNTLNPNSITIEKRSNHNHNEDTNSINGSISTNANDLDNENIATLNDMMNSMMLNSEHYKQIYMDILRNFECEQLNFNLNQTVDEINQMEENTNTISELMCTMVDSICDEPETLSIDARLMNESLISEENLNGVSNLKRDFLNNHTSTNGFDGTDSQRMNGHANTNTNGNEQGNTNGKPVIKDPELIGTICFPYFDEQFWSFYKQGDSCFQ